MLGCVVCGHCEQTPAKTASSVQLGKMVLGVVGDDQVCCSSFAFTKDIPENDWFPPTHTHLIISSLFCLIFWKWV